MYRTNNANSYKFSLIFICAAACCFMTTVQGHVLEFSVEPSDTVVEAGQSAVLDCMVKAANHQSSVLIQWLDQDGSKLNFIGDNYRSQLTNGSLYINNVVEEQRLTGTYRCMATLPNVGSIISKTAKLSIASLLGFYEEPSDIKVYVGQKAHFTCYVNAVPPPKVRWLKDERPLQYDQLRMTLLPSGALEIDEVVESDQGSYRCNASGLSASKLSNKAQLVINGDHEQAPLPSAPVFIAKPHSQVVVEGQNVSLDCAANGNPSPTITWLKDGYTIDMNDLDSRFSVVGSTKSLLITNIQEQDTGTYQCRAANREDSMDASANIHVQVPPRFLKRPQDKTEFEKRDIELECEVYGIPEPTVKWYKNGEVILKSEYYKVVNGNNLKIMGLLTSDSGLFQCFASNPAGNIQAVANLRITVKRKRPVKMSDGPLNKQKHTQTVARDSLFSLQSSGDTFIKTNTHLGKIESAYTSKYPKLIATSNQDGGNGTDGVPGPPQDLRAPLIKARFIILKWDPPAVNGDNILTYSVYYRQEGSIRERHQNTSRVHFEEASIADLVPDKVYHFRVVAINANGVGESSKSLTVTTQYEEHVSTAPQHFEAYAIGPHSINISWQPPDSPNGRIIRYNIYYIETSKSIEHIVDTTKLSYKLTGLTPYTEYSVWVVAFNEKGRGAATEEINVITYSDAPSEPPQNVTVEPSSTSIMIRWEEPPIDSQNGVISGYKLKYRKPGKKASTITTTADKRQYELTDLELSTVYQVKISALNVNGTGPSTEWMDVRTFDNDLDESVVPPKPASIKVRPASDKLYILWTAPHNQQIRIRNYVIGWGKGIPDMYSHELDERSRTYIIDKLEPNSEYVLSLRACNDIGAGPPIYTTVRTEDEPPPEQPAVLMPPVGLKAQVISTTSVVLYWTDQTLAKNQPYSRESRMYKIKYTDEKQKSKYVNVTTTNAMIQDLRPNTLYEFCVKLIKGRKESAWSMVVQNRTWEMAPNLPPRDLDVHLKDEASQMVEATWQPPKTSSGRITGYVILYTDNETKSDPEWHVLAIKGDHNSTVIYNLRPFTLYYFKVQARNSRGYGPFSNIVTFRTGQITVYSNVERNEAKGIFTGNVLLAIIIGGCVVALVTIIVVGVFLCCRKKNVTTSLDRSKKGYQKGTQNIKPPDLWIHHDQMELKAMEKRHSTNDGASSSGAMTLPRSVGGNEYDNHDGVHTNSLDKRNYGPNYAIATPINNSAMSQSSSDSTPSSRPPYPRTQYSMSRAHVSLDPAASGSNQQASEPLYNPHQVHSNYESTATNSSYISQPPPLASHSSSGGGYAPGLSVLNDNQGGKQRVPAQGHPLKSFTVPAPPPISAPSTPQPKHIVTVRPNTSPYKKPPTSSTSTLTSTPPSRISASNPPPHTAEEVQRLQPSHSTEELNQEMANLEGLMLTLNAITANEFEC